MNVGEKKISKVPSKEAFGEHKRELVKVIKREEFPKDLKPEIGLQIQIKRKDGDEDIIKVTNVTETEITLDANHPLAGKDLIFEIELLDIINVGPSAESYYILGSFLQEKGIFDEAIQCYQKAIAVNPNFIDAHFNLGVAYQQLGQHDKAVAPYQKAIDLNPENPKAHLNLGIAFKEQGLYDEASEAFKNALRIKPDYAMAYYNLGNVYLAKGQYNDAMDYYKKTISIDQEYAEAHWNIALLNLLFGNFKEGWQRYEWRWKLGDLAVKRTFDKPQWDGSDINGKTILIYTEQGFGDTIQFIRYIPLIAKRGAKVIIECEKELIVLLRNIEGVHDIFLKGSPLPEFDFHCPLLSLPLIFNTTVENIPTQIPYIKVDTELSKRWRGKILNNSKLNVGLTWAGSPELRKDYNRSCTFETFSQLLKISDINFYSLQKGEASYQISIYPEGLNILDYTEEFNDFADTAGFIENLDLVISVDTAVAHLAGALGKPVWTLLPFVPDWRWMLGREDSPWYPTMRLFRQPSIGDWKSVIDKVEEELRKLIDN